MRSHKPAYYAARPIAMTPSVNRKLASAPTISVPKPSDDKPKFGRVGIIAAVGFVVGIAWPGIAQLELVPRPPNESVRVPAASALPSAEAAPALGSAGALAPDAAAKAASPEVKGSSVEKVGPKVRLAEIVSCVDADGKKHKRCGELALDRVVTEPMRSLLACDGVEGQVGIFSLGFDVDFNAQKLSGFTVGRSTTLPAQVAKGLRDCADGVLSKLELTGIEHGFNSYRVFYLVEFASPSEPSQGLSGAPAGGGLAVESGSPGAATSGSPPGELSGASGRATVAWEVALVRKAPKDGAVIARVLGGTRLVVTGRQGDWYRVKYDAQGNEGFVFKAAIGL